MIEQRVMQHQLNDELLFETGQDQTLSLLDHSDRLSKNQALLEANWNLLLHSLTDTAKQQYQAALHKDRDPARTLLYQYFLYCGALEAEIQWDSNTYFHMGVAAKSDLAITIHAGSGRFRSSMRIHKDSADIVQPVFQSEILPLARRILRSDLDITGRNWIDYLHLLETFIRGRTRKTLIEGQPVSFLHFRFQNLNHYFGLLGEAGARQLIRDIDQTIRDYLKETDVSVILSPHSFLVIAPGSAGDDLYQQFQAVYFEIRSLILDYSIQVHTIYSSDISLFDIFRALKI